MKVVADNKGLRKNDGKVPYQYFPPEALSAIGEHYRKGNEKYAPRNWERGMAWTTCFDSLQRHAWAWLAGEDRDPETGSLHMVAVAWNAIALITYHIRGIGVDDRAKVGRPEEGEGSETAKPRRKRPSRDTEVFAEGDPIPI